MLVVGRGYRPVSAHRRSGGCGTSTAYVPSWAVGGYGCLVWCVGVCEHGIELVLGLGIVCRLYSLVRPKICLAKLIFCMAWLRISRLVGHVRCILWLGGGGHWATVYYAFDVEAMV